jgi:hypothetical protein
MAKRQVIIELAYQKDVAEHALTAQSAPDAGLEMGAVPKIAGCTLDAGFAATPVAGLTPRSAMAEGYESGVRFDVALEPNEQTYVVRGEADESKLDDIANARGVVGVYADVQIEPTLICPGSPPMGTHIDVERLLCVPQMKAINMDGAGVLVAIVDSGINSAHLNAAGKPHTLDAARSWVPTPGMVPGNAPVGHGTMCAFDALIAAPKATLLDVQLLRSSASGPTIMSGVLSDGVRAYNHLIRVMTAPRRPGENRSMVVNNSWGMFKQSWDFPVGHPGNYSNNPAHPFNRIVSALERVGADILFAAGNCGTNCPDGRCDATAFNTIFGANSHPSVITVGGVDISKTRVGYSSQGPGRLSRNKPDVCGFTHFRGSGVYAADGGTSAASPVVAGVVAAVRSKRPFSPGSAAASPAAIRSLLRTTAEDLGAAGFDFDHGFGVISGCALYRRFRIRWPIDICRIAPHICQDRPLPIDFCRRYPNLCRDWRWPIPPIPVPDPIRDPIRDRLPIPPVRDPIRPNLADLLANPEGLDDEQWAELVALAYELGQDSTTSTAPSSAGGTKPAGGCGCA